MQYPNADQCRQRLAELDLTVELVARALGLASADIRGCTDFDAPAMAGVMFWSRANRYLAEDLVGEGWARTSRDSILRVIHPTRSHAITAISADGGVGDLKSEVRSKNPKGAAMARLVEKNGQLPLLTPDEVMYGRELDEIPTWCLLYKRGKEALLAELSLPVKMNGKFINQWNERIPIFLPDDFTDPGTDVSLLDDPLDVTDPDVGVEWKDSAEG